MAFRRSYPYDSAVQRLHNVVSPYSDLISKDQREKLTFWIDKFIKARLMSDPVREVSVVWSIRDVQAYRADLTECEAMLVLKEALQRHKKEISQRVLARIADELFDHRYIYGTLEDEAGRTVQAAIFSLVTSRVHLASTIEDLSVAGGSRALHSSMDGYFSVGGFNHLHLSLENGHAYGVDGFGWQKLAEFAKSVRDAGVPIHHLSEIGTTESTD